MMFRKISNVTLTMEISDENLSFVLHIMILPKCISILDPCQVSYPQKDHHISLISLLIVYELI